MAARKKIVTETVEDVAATDADSIFDRGELLEEEQETALDGLLAEFGGAEDTNVNIYRAREGSRHLAFLFKTDVGETGGTIMEQCRDNYGTGEYRMQVRQGGQLVANRVFAVEAPEKPDPSTVQQNNNTEMVALITSQMTNQQSMFTATINAMAQAFQGREPAPAPDPIAMQTSMVHALTAMKELATPANTDSGRDLVEMLIQGMTLAQTLGGKDGDTNSSDILMEAMRQFAPTIAATVGKPSPAPLAAPQPGRVGPDGQIQPLQPQPNPEGEDVGLKDRMEKAVFKQQLGWLVNQAIAGKDPSLYAELLLDQIGPEKVLEFVGRDDALEKLAEIDERVKLYAPWFEAIKTEVIALTTPAEPEIAIQTFDANEVQAVHSPGEADTESADEGVESRSGAVLNAASNS